MTKKRLILTGTLLLVLLIAGFSAFENYSFNNYLTTQMGKNMNIPINQKAPVKSEGTIEIKAPIDTVWQVLTKIEDWPEWQKNVTESKLEGTLKEGAAFKWKAGGISFASRIHTMKPKTMFGWTGKTTGAGAIHNWTFFENNDITKVQVEESLQGVLPGLFRRYFQNNLDAGVKNNLEELRIASEHYKNK